jgi:hypothetical protein
MKTVAHRRSPSSCAGDVGHCGDLDVADEVAFEHLRWEFGTPMTM